ncbi:MAG: maltose alpha-D-glucosyltransferase [Verrucomicrobiia bacterium]
MARTSKRSKPIPFDPAWYKTAVLYELHVRAFQDSNADGIGDFPGLTERLDYLQELGVTAIWLLPFYPSPLKDDGYDIADYYSINPIYGTLDDFKVFLHEAHARGLRVITELVVNHTSDQHPWFQRARRAKAGSPARDFYVWSDNPNRYREARIIFKDFEHSNWTWDPAAQAYYWHRFYSHQPDLNYDNLEVHAEITRVLDFWLDMGVDGLRLDAVPYLYEREGTSCENLPETHAYLKTLRRHVDTKYGDRVLLAEANQWPEDAVSYFGSGKGDECHMAFHFPLMPRLFMALRMEDRVPIVDILEQTPPIPETSQWALFLRNHDELTLEMVTDEERDYMYRVYAHDRRARINLGIRRRLAPLLGHDRRRFELLHLLLLSLPGTPVLYYGDEIGMGDNTFLGDRNGVRTPMQWSSDKNAGFSRASPHALYLPIILDPEYHYESVNVEAQQANPHSLLWWTRRVLALRKRWGALGLGSIEFLQPENRKVLAFTRHDQDQHLLVVANLSRFPQPVSLDLSRFQGSVPVELFGQTEFPVIADKPYALTLSPHAVFWFSVKSAQSPEAGVAPRMSDCHLVQDDWEELLTGEDRTVLEGCLPGYLVQRRWFGGKGKEIKTLRIREAVPVPFDSTKAFLTLLQVEYVEGDPEGYTLPITFAAGSDAERIQHDRPGLVIARVKLARDGTEGVLYDAVAAPAFSRALLDAVAQQRRLRGMEGELRTLPTPAFADLCGPEPFTLEPVVGSAEQSNTSVVFGDKLMLKIFRRLEPGLNPDVEINRFLAEKGFPHVPPFAGSLEYRRATGDPVSLGIITGYVPAARDAWEYALDSLTRYFERVRSLPEGARFTPVIEGSVLDLAGRDTPAEITGILGTFMELTRMLGTRTGELHLALASDPDNPEFAPDPLTPFYQRSLYQSNRNLLVQITPLLRRRLPNLPDPVRALAETVLANEGELLRRLRAVYETRIHGQRIRCHGDFHLGQVLYTGKDFVLIDFEGEPARPLGERRIKRSPLRDVAGMIRSFHYVVHTAFLRQVEQGSLGSEIAGQVEPWARLWFFWMSATYLRAYLDVVRSSELLPKSQGELRTLLDAHLFEKAIYEVGYELNNRPDWLKIPLQGIIQHLELGAPRE